MKNPLLLLSALLVSTAPAQQLIFESASVGTTGQTSGGAAITSFQFIGSRFEISSQVQVTGIGGHFYTPTGSNGEMFGAIIHLDSLSSLPTGIPFGSGIVVSTVVTVPSASSFDYNFPVSATLTPGFYGLIFGKGQLGAAAAGVVGAAEGLQNLSPHYMVWEDSQWADGGFPNARLTVYGIPEPSSAILLLTCSILACQRPRKHVSPAKDTKLSNRRPGLGASALQITKKALPPLLVVILAITGCVTSQTTNVIRTTYSDTEKSKIVIIYEEPSRAYEVLGLVQVESRGGIASRDRVGRAFQAEAAKLGADAVLIQDLPHFDNAGLTPLPGNGKALKWK